MVSLCDTNVLFDSQAVSGSFIVRVTSASFDSNCIICTDIKTAPAKVLISKVCYNLWKIAQSMECWIERAEMLAN